MKILNLYAGIDGNRWRWGNEHEITAIEINPDIAKVYQDLFPKDKVIVTDAQLCTITA
jgi:DNA (cytosine-5)-methyltransferase 1